MIPLRLIDTIQTILLRQQRLSSPRGQYQHKNIHSPKRKRGVAGPRGGLRPVAYAPGYVGPMPSSAMRAADEGVGSTGYEGGGVAIFEAVTVNVRRPASGAARPDRSV